MSIFFRVHKGKDDPGTLYDRSFSKTDNQPSASDLVLSATTAQWTLINASRPTHVVLRVHEDRLNQDIEQGVLYDESFRLADKEILRNGNPVLFTVTPDEFDAVRLTK